MKTPTTPSRPVAYDYERQEWVTDGPEARALLHDQCEATINLLTGPTGRRYADAVGFTWTALAMRCVSQAIDLADLATRLRLVELAIATLAEDPSRREDAEALAAALEAHLSDLPTFGGYEPGDTLGIYSWDATRVLVYSGSRWLVRFR